MYNNCQTWLVESDKDRHGPAAVPGVQHGTTRTFSMVAWYVGFGGTLDRCPGGVLRSIGQSVAQCQKQKAPWRDSLCTVSPTPYCGRGRSVGRCGMSPHALTYSDL